MASVQCFLCDFAIMLSAISASGMEHVHGSTQLATTLIQQFMTFIV